MEVGFWETLKETLTILSKLMTNDLFIDISSLDFWEPVNASVASELKS